MVKALEQSTGFELDGLHVRHSVIALTVAGGNQVQAHGRRRSQLILLDDLGVVNQGTCPQACSRQDTGSVTSSTGANPPPAVRMLVVWP